MADNENISLNKEEVGEADKPKLVSDKPQKKERSFGNKTFDKVIYPFFAFFLVAVFSIVSVVKTKFGSGKPKEFYDNLVRKTADLLEKTPIVKNKSKELQQKMATNTTDISVSFIGGTLLVAPIKLFEDKRKEVSHFFDKINEKYFGGKKINPDDYAEEPKQSWATILLGRLIVVIGVVAIAALIGRKTDYICQKLATNMPWSKSSNDTKVANLTNSEKWTWATAFEGVYTAISFLIFYASSRILPSLINKEDSKPANEKTNHNLSNKYQNLDNNLGEPLLSSKVSKLGENRNSIKPKAPLESHVLQEAARPPISMSHNF